MLQTGNTLFGKLKQKLRNHSVNDRKPGNIHQLRETFVIICKFCKSN